MVGRASEAVVGSWAKALAAAGMAGQAGGIGGRELGRPGQGQVWQCQLNRIWKNEPTQPVISSKPASGYTGAEVREEVVTGFAAGAPGEHHQSNKHGFYVKL